MSRTRIDNPKLESRLADLAAAPKLGRAKDATITVHTFARQDVAWTEPSPRIETAELSDVDLASIPRITLGGGDGDGAPLSTSDGSTRELVELGVLGEGGMGRVILARQTSLGREVAVKTLRENASAADIAALVREARTTGALEHPSIVPVHALGMNKDGRPLLVMKRIHGVSWKRLVDDAEHPAWAAHLGERRALLDANIEVLTAVCRALELAHARGVIHRDVKPENVMIGAFGEVCLVDWGIATTPDDSEHDDLIVGTPSYMAPEMVQGGRVDERTDVYLLGATLHRLLTGQARHDGFTILETVGAAVLSEPFRYDSRVPAALAALCNAACSAAPSDRPSTVRAFRERLVAFDRHRSAIATCDVANDRLRRLHALLKDADGATPQDLALAYRLGTEARFAFAQSLEQFPDHEEARRGRVACIEALADLELRQDHIETAAALLDEAPEARASVATRLATARRDAIATAHEHQRLRSVDHDMDRSVGRTARLFTLGALFLLAVPLSAIIIVDERAGAPLTPEKLLIVMVIMFAATLVAIVARRRQLFGNVFSSKAAGLFLFVAGALTVNRGVGVLRHASVPAIVMNDMLILTVTLAVAALLLARRLWFAVPVCLMTMVLLAYEAARPSVIVPAAMILTVVLVALTTHAEGTSPGG